MVIFEVIEWLLIPFSTMSFIQLEDCSRLQPPTKKQHPTIVNPTNMEVNAARSILQQIDDSPSSCSFYAVVVSCLVGLCGYSVSTPKIKRKHGVVLDYELMIVGGYCTCHPMHSDFYFCQLH